MFLRLFMLIIKPSDKILKSRSNGALNTFRIELYDFILKRLLKSYSHYAISDTVLIESKGVKLIHEYRDMEFENELSRNKISFLPRVKAVTLPYSQRKPRRKSFFSYFRFKDTLAVDVDGKKLYLAHDDIYSVSGNLKANAKCSGDYIGLPIGMIEVNSRAGASDVGPSAKPKEPRRTSRSEGGIFAKDKELTPRTDTLTTDRPKEDTEDRPATIGKNGFDIDTSF